MYYFISKQLSFMKQSFLHLQNNILSLIILLVLWNTLLVWWNLSLYIFYARLPNIPDLVPHFHILSHILKSAVLGCWLSYILEISKQHIGIRYLFRLHVTLINSFKSCLCDFLKQVRLNKNFKKIVVAAKLTEKYKFKILFHTFFNIN